MRSERFKWLVTAEGPFASVYFDDSHDTANAAEQLDAKWCEIRKRFVDLGASMQILDKLEEAVRHFRPAVGRAGRAVIATNGRVLLNEHLISPPQATVVRLSDYPYITPLIELETQQRPTYVFAAVDHTGADITLFRAGSITSTSIEGAGYPVHKPATAGWNGYGSFEHEIEEAIRVNCRVVAAELTRLVDEVDPGAVFVCGEVRSRASLISELPDRVTRRLTQLHAGSRKTGIDEKQVRETISAEFDRRRSSERMDVADRFEAEIGCGSGLAAEGLAAVCAALRSGDVDTLIIGELGDATVVVGKRSPQSRPTPMHCQNSANR